MSARKVCSGNRPCKCHSLRAISAPFRRPLTFTLMPCAPKRSDSSTAFLMARRKAMRFSSCAAIFSACSCAFSSGLWISWIDTSTSAGLRRQVALELVDLGALAADDDSGSRSVDDDLQAIRGPFDIDVRYPRARKAVLEIAFKPQIFKQKLAELLFGKPVRVPVFVVAESKTVWMNFLTHNLLQFSTVVYSSLAASSLVAFFFEVRFAAGFSVAPSSVFGVARFALGAAAAPPRLRCLLSASFAGFASTPGCLPLAAGRSSLLKEIVTWQKCRCSR